MTADDATIRLLEQIHDVVGDAGILTGDDVAARPDRWPPGAGCKACAIVRPGSTDEVARVMKLCAAAGQSVVPHGGLTGMVGGSVAREQDLVASVERMRLVEDVDRVNRTMTVQAGAVLQAVQAAAEEAGLMFPLDLGARGSCTIGGTIATNAGGNSVIRYGMVREQVLGLEAVLADGRIIASMNSVIKNNTGYDLKQLFIGSEGTLGIVTRAVLRLRPLPCSWDTALLAVPDFDRVAGLLQFMDASLGGSLSAFEVMWNDFYRLVVGEGETHRPPLSIDHDFYVLLESNGSDEDTDRSRFERALGKAIADGLVADAVVAQNRLQREDLWAIREDVDTVASRMHPILAFDVSLDISKMDAYVHELRETLSRRLPSARAIFFGHIGDGNIHPCITVGSLEPATVRQVTDIVYDALRKRGGVISAEHGIGLDKRRYLGHSRSAEEIALMKTVKQALDPQNLLNPGKVFPE